MFQECVTGLSVFVVVCLVIAYSLGWLGYKLVIRRMRHSQTASLLLLLPTYLPVLGRRS